MKSKKMMSARKKEFVTDGIFSCCLIAGGLIVMLWDTNVYSIITMIVIQILMWGSLLMRRCNSEPWTDEIRGHYGEARKQTLFALEGVFIVTAISLLVVRRSVRIGPEGILLILGFMNLFRTLSFIWIDRKRTVLKEA